MTQAFLSNHLWQSTVFAAAAAVVALAMRRNSARVRFGIWLAASLKFLIPFGALALLGGLLRWPQAQVVAAPALVAASEPFQRIVLAAPVSAAPSRPLWPLVLLAIWLLVSAFLALRWWTRWRRLSLIARAATPSRRLGPIPVLTTNAAIEPGIFGLFRPVLLLPAKLEDRLSPAQLEAVLAHERCHARRRDNLWSALHMVVETLFWFHPLVWWIGARLVTERERACDEAVLRQGGDPEAYASGILQVCRYYLESPLACAAGISGGELKSRLAAILRGGWGRNLSRSRQLLLAGMAAVALLGPVAAGIVFGQSTSAAPAVAAAPTAPAAPAAFEVVSIKRFVYNGHPYEACGDHGDPGMLRYVNCSLLHMVERAYGLKDYQVESRGPAWVDTDLYQVVARSPEPASHAQMMAMLQAVLAGRFGLQLRTDRRDLQAYLLKVAPHGSKLQPAVNTGHCGEITIRAGLISADCLSADDIVWALEEAPELRGIVHGRPVLNDTGLPPAGRYRIDLHFAASADAVSGPSLFSALPSQLGLRLEAGKMPTSVLVILSAHRPSEN